MRAGGAVKEVNFSVRDCCTSGFYNKVSVGPWHHPPPTPPSPAVVWCHVKRLRIKTCSWGALLLSSNIFPFVYTQTMMSSYIKLHAFRSISLLCVDSGVQLIFIPTAKILYFIVRSHYGGHRRSYISYMGHKESLIPEAFLISQGAPPPSNEPLVYIKCNNPWNGRFLFSVLFDCVMHFFFRGIQQKDFKESHRQAAVIIIYLCISQHVKCIGISN